MKGSKATPRLIWILAVVCLALSPAASNQREYRSVTILHTNDTHGHLLPFDYTSAQQDVGGIARRATLAREIRAEAGGNALLMDAGDVLDGTPFSIEFMGEADFAAMSAAGYDLIVVGNHELTPTLEEFHRNVEISTFPFTSANMLDRETGELALPAYVIYDFQGAKAAVFGLTVPSSEYNAAREGLEFLDPIETAREFVPQLREKADIVIALTHLGYGEDQRLAGEVSGIDVIIGGHSHTRLATPALVKHDVEPQAFSIGGTIIAHAGEKGVELGRLDLRLRSDGGPFTLMSYTGSLIPITSDIPECPDTADVVARYYSQISDYYDETIVEASDEFIHHPGHGSALLNLICDAIRETAGVEIAVYGTGGIRANIPAGHMTAWDMATVLPFTHRVVILEMTGERLKQGLMRFRPGVSGMRYHIAGDRLLEATIDGRPIDDNALYKVATIDWLMNLFFDDVKSREILDIGILHAVIDYVKAQEVISPLVDGRRRVE